MSKSTEKIEIVEAHNLSLSLRRLRNAPGYSVYGKWQSALYHALVQTSGLSEPKLTTIRQALGLP